MVKPLHTATVGDSDAPVRSVAVQVEVVEGPDRGLTALFEQGTVLIGSSDGCELKLTDPSVSRRHVLLHLEGARLRVEDLGSKNGTRYLDARIGSVHVPYGAHLVIGRTRLALMPPRQSTTQATAREAFGPMLGRSLVMRVLFDELERAAASDAPVMLVGETGAGKEVAARSLHQASKRAKGPFVVFDCSAVPESLWQSALFGHVKGAFTGATNDVTGVLEQANGGTLFFDHLTALPLSLQASLLRALEARRFTRLGDTRERGSDFRLLASSQTDPEDEVRAGRFRLDLLHRTSALSVTVPPLRAHPEDVALLATQFAKALNVTVPAVKLAEWTGSAWPGNVRELQNAVHRLAADTLGADVVLPPVGYTETRDAALRAFERQYLEELLKKHGGPTAAAKAAGLARSHFYRLLDAHGLVPKKRG